MKPVRAYTIDVVAGDGIGQEVMHAAGATAGFPDAPGCRSAR